MPLTVLAAALTLTALSSNPALDRKVEGMLPTPDENRFMQIPWRADVMRAVAEANEKGKPIFFWVMNGHPLGST